METIRANVIEVFESMPDIFSAPVLCKRVQQRMLKDKRMPMDGTILRRLRETRADGITMYKIFDSAKSLYQKI